VLRHSRRLRPSAYNEAQLKPRGRNHRAAAKRCSALGSCQTTLRCCLAVRSGFSSVEFALVSMLLFAFIIGTIEIGRILWTLNALHYGAQQAARCAAVNSALCGSDSLLQSWAAGIGGSSLPGTAFHQSSDACGIRVTATYTMQLMVPYVNINPTLHATACFPISG